MSGGSWVVENQWTCSTCGTVNPGREMKCSACGKPKEQEAYQTGGAAQAAAVTDPSLVQMAQGGVNWTCTYCSYQNRNLHDRCERCGAEKAESVPAAGAPQPVAGVVGTPVGQGLPPGATVTKVPVPESKMPWGKIGCLGLLVGMCLLGVYFFKPKAGEAQVTATSWMTKTLLEQRTQRQGQGFRDAIPDGGIVLSCEQRQVGTMQCNPYPCVVAASGQCNPHECNCQNQCRDLGNGFSECTRVCQTCFDTCPVGQQSTCYQQCPRVGDYCRYTYDDWQAIERRAQSGTSDTPAYATDLHANGPDQRVRNETELSVAFVSGRDTYTYRPRDLADYRRFRVGAKWSVETTNAGGFTPTEPR